MPVRTAKQVVDDITMEAEGVEYGELIIRALREAGYHIISEAEWERNPGSMGGYEEFRVTGVLDDQLCDAKQEIYKSVLEDARDPEHFLRYIHNNVGESFVKFIGEQLGYLKEHVS